MQSRAEIPASCSGPSSVPDNFLQVTLHRCRKTNSIRHVAQVSEPAGLLIRVLQLRFCPKAELPNISEFHPVRELFLYAKRNEWCSFQLASTFLVARGVRGREGVQVVEKFVKQVPKVEWENAAFVEDFYNVFHPLGAGMYGEHAWPVLCRIKSINPQACRAAMANWKRVQELL